MSLLTESEQNLFQLQSICYVYVPWSIPVSWDSGYKMLTISHSIWKHPTIYLIYGLLVIYAILNGCIAASYGWIFPKPNFSVAQCLILMLVCIPTCLYVTTLLNLFQMILIDTYNKFLHLSNQIRLGMTL